jgi:rRNA biogenesis protein RRP5
MAPVKRKSNAVESSSAKALAKRQRTDTAAANSDNVAEKSAGKSSKAGAGSSKPGNPVPTSLWKNEQPAFPRGGASLLTPIERKQIEAQATRDALKEHASSSDLFSTSGKVRDESHKEGITQRTPDGSKHRRKKTSKRHEPSEGGQQENAAVRIEGLSYKVSRCHFPMMPVSDISKEDIRGIPYPWPDHEHQLPRHRCCSSKQPDRLRSFDGDLQPTHC